MKKKATLNQKKGQEFFLTPISVVGVVVPKEPFAVSNHREFKLVTLCGVEYSLHSDSEWQQVLENYRWEEVRVRGLLNSSTMTIFPLWVIPRGPTGETQRVSEAPWLDRNIVGKFKKAVADLVLAPAFA